MWTTLCMCIVTHPCCILHISSVLPYSYPPFCLHFVNEYYYVVVLYNIFYLGKLAFLSNWIEVFVCLDTAKKDPTGKYECCGKRTNKVFSKNYAACWTSHFVAYFCDPSDHRAQTPQKKTKTNRMDNIYKHKKTILTCMCSKKSSVVVAK